jgi:glycosyltransferase involved in cell wall biosynthesis
MDDVWVVVPMYNEATTVGAVVAELRQSFTHVLCVDDGSSDGSAHLARSAGATVVSHAVNLGQGAALQTAFTFVRRHTDASYCVTFDADGQHRTEDAVRMVEELRRSGADVALASRFLGETGDIPRARRWVLRAGLAFTNATTGLRLTDTHNGLRVLNRKAVVSVRLRQSRMAYASELLTFLSKSDLSYIEVPTCVVYTEYSRTKGQQNINAINILYDLVVARMRSAA